MIGQLLSHGRAINFVIDLTKQQKKNTEFGTWHIVKSKQNVNSEYLGTEYSF